LATLYIAFDSVLKFQGDAIVNAANTGCLGGGGIDRMVNDLGDDEIWKARQALPALDSHGYKRCETGDAKITIAGNLPCSKVIHAVGPRFGYMNHEENLLKLEETYKSAMERAQENGLTSVGFCIISAGIFRGNCPLDTVIKTALESIAKYAYAGLQTVVFCGYTPEERHVITHLAEGIRAACTA
jgi:O-acetyl-ADP-ribose deacetylase